MVDLLYQLESISSNLEGIFGGIGFLILIFGIVNAFFGYKLFKIMLSIIGFLVGTAVGLILFLRNGSADSNAMIVWIFIGGFIGATLADIFYDLGVFLAVGLVGASTVFIITQNISSSIALGVICGIVSVFLEKYVIIVTTALSGGALTATGIWFIRLSNGEYASPQVLGWIIGICGIVFQLWTETWLKTNDEEETDIGIADIVIDIIAWIIANFFVKIKDFIVLVLLSLRKGNPKDNLHKNPPPGNAYLGIQQKGLQCPNCRTVFDHDLTFCSKCGSRIQTETTVREYVFCSKCGAELPSNARFCAKCGAAQK